MDESKEEILRRRRWFDEHADAAAGAALVSGRIEFWRRRQNLSWSHHAEVAAANAAAFLAEEEAAQERMRPAKLATAESIALLLSTHTAEER